VDPRPSSPLLSRRRFSRFHGTSSTRSSFNPRCLLLSRFSAWAPEPFFLSPIDPIYTLRLAPPPPPYRVPTLGRMSRGTILPGAFLSSRQPSLSVPTRNYVPDHPPPPKNPPTKPKQFRKAWKPSEFRHELLPRLDVRSDF